MRRTAAGLRVAPAICLVLMLAQAPWLQARPLALQDIHRLEAISAPALSRDGAQLAYVVGTHNLDSDASVSDVWLVAWDGSGRRNLSATPFASEWQPTWRPDGRALAYLSDDTPGETTQVRLLDLASGAARTISALSGGVDDFVWAPDGKRIALVASDPLPQGGKDSRGKARPRPPIEIDRFQFKEDGRDYLEGQRRRLYLLDVASGRTEVLSAPGADTWKPAWSPDGRLIAYVGKSGADPDRSADFDVFVVEPRAGAAARRVSRLVGADNDPYWDARPAWSPDSRKLLWLQSGADKWVYYEPWQLVVADLDSGRLTTPARIDRSFNYPRWSADGRHILALVEQPESTWLARIDPRSDRLEYLTEGPRFGLDFDVAADDRIALLEADDRNPLAIHALQPTPGGTEARVLARHNEWLDEVERVEARALSVRSFDGTTVHALLTLPAGYDGKRPLPTIVRLHGGPVYQFSREFMFDWQLYAAHGFAVLAVNPRGSSGRGFDFARAIYADWGNLDVKDVLAAVDHVVAAGIADPRRLGVGGRSYGGILTNYVIASDRRFAAAWSEAGSSNVLAMYGHDQYAAAMEQELGTPWRNADVYLRLSYPFLHADRIVTPTAFACMQEDFNVPCAGSEQMYQALRSTGVPTRLILYPGENHQLTVPSYLYHRQKNQLEWYARHLRH